jgi:hypothetical protein
MKLTFLPLVVVLVLAMNDRLQSAPLPDLKLSGNRVETARHIITLAPSGLPQQIAVKMDASEIPLAWRSRRPSPNQLTALGRGDVLRGAVAVQAVVDEQMVEAQIRQPARPAVRNGQVVCQSKLEVGPVQVSLDLAYGRDGSMRGTITYSGGKVDVLELVVPIESRVDTVVAGQPVADAVKQYPDAAFSVGTKQGLAWGNSDTDAKQAGGSPQPGVLTHLYVGSGDQGFTWLCNGANGWTVDPKASTMTIDRNDGLEPTWHIRFVNHTATLSRKTVEFALLTHPSTIKPSDHRRQAWLAWPDAQGGAATAKLSLADWEKAKARPQLRADAAIALESTVDYAILSGPAGGDALSAKRNHTDTYPIPLMRYLAGTQTGNVVRLRSNAIDITNPGADPATDRVLLGRALLFDIGLDAARVANLAQARNVLLALGRFGYFEDDGQTEFIPFWRSSSIVRFGQSFSGEDLFETESENPLAEVYVSVYCRPIDGGKRKVMIVVVNESDQPVRDSLYIMNPAHVFDGENVISGKDVVAKYDFTGIDERSDWGQPGAVWTSRGTCLEDLEDHGRVDRFRFEDGIDSYGPTVFIPAHSFRILGAVGGQLDKRGRRR